MSGFSEMVERLTNAAGADRELDADVMALCFPEWAKRGSPFLSSLCEGDEPIYWHGPSWIYKQPVPPLSASIDAVLSIVDKVRPDADIEWFRDARGELSTVVLEAYGSGPHTGQHEQPPIAICLALMRSFEAREIDA